MGIGTEKKPVRGKRETVGKTEGTRRLQNPKGMTENGNIKNHPATKRKNEQLEIRLDKRYKWYKYFYCLKYIFLMFLVFVCVLYAHLYRNLPKDLSYPEIPNFILASYISIHSDM